MNRYLNTLINGKSTQWLRWACGLDLLVIQPQVPSNLMCLELRILGGWDVEQPHELGFAHWLEHSALGFPSKRFPQHQQTIDHLANVGLTTTAQTSPTDTLVRLVGLASSAPEVLHLMWEWFFHPLFDPVRLEAERKAVLQELRMRSWNEWVPVDQTMEHLTHPNPRRNSDPQAEIRVIQHAQLNSLAAFRQKHYLPGNAVVVVCLSDPLPFLNMAFELQACSRVNQPLSSLRPSQQRSTTAVELKSIVKQVLALPSEQPLAKILLQKPIRLTAFSADASAVQALAFILGRPDLSSRLLSRLRGDLGLVYWVDVNTRFHPWDSNLSYLQIRTECNAVHVPRVVQLCVEALTAMAEEKPPTASEVERFVQTKRVDAESKAMVQHPERFIKDYSPILTHQCEVREPAQLLEKCCSLTRTQVVAAAKRFLGSPSEALFIVCQK